MVLSKESMFMNTFEKVKKELLGTTPQNVWAWGIE